MEAPTFTTPATFLSLPAELRNKIYRLQFIRGTFCIYTCAGRPWSTVLDLYCASRLPLNLLRSCRQVRSEAASILYGENVFAFPDSMRCTMDFQRWLELIGSDNRMVLRNVNISPPLGQFPREVLATFIACSKLLRDATELNLPLVKSGARPGSVTDLVLRNGEKCKKITVQRVGEMLEMAWTELK